MPKHFKANAVPDPQPLSIHCMPSFGKLPELVRDIVQKHHGDGMTLLSSLESRLRDFPEEEQREIMTLFFEAIGMPVVEWLSSDHPSLQRPVSNDIPQQTGRL